MKWLFSESQIKSSYVMSCSRFKIVNAVSNDGFRTSAQTVDLFQTISIGYKIRVSKCFISAGFGVFLGNRSVAQKRVPYLQTHNLLSIFYVCYKHTLLLYVKNSGFLLFIALQMSFAILQKFKCCLQARPLLNNFHMVKNLQYDI